MLAITIAMSASSLQALGAETNVKLLTRYIAGQIVPNRTVSRPLDNRDGLVLSYSVPRSDGSFRYVGRRTSTYDNAMAVIALTMAGEDQLAIQIIEALISSAPPPPRPGRDEYLDGDLWFAMNTHDLFPDRDSGYGAIVRTGSSCWAGYAILYYIQASLHRNPKALNSERLQSYLAFSERIARAVLMRRVLDPDDLRFGLITGGLGTFTYKDGVQHPIEIYKPEAVEWCSTEHNIDAYFFLRDLAKLTKKHQYQEAAEWIRDGLLRNFNDIKGQFNRGVSATRRDELMALDAASWGSMFLFAVGQEAMALQSLKSTERYRNISNGVLGYRPAAESLVYESVALQKFYFPKNPQLSWEQHPLVWSEGSLGVALAYLRAGFVNDSRRILRAVLSSKMVASGGVRYADRTLEQQFLAAPSVASSAWAIIVLKQIEGAPLADLFWSRW